MARLRIETAPEITVYDESFVIKAASGASAPLAEFKNSAGTVVASIGVDGTANLASPALTGTPTAPTAAATTNTTQVATTQFVRTEIANLIGTAGATLDTLGELATALGNDVALSTTLTNSIALKAPIASPTFTGTVTIPSGASISGFALLASPELTGSPTVPTQSPLDGSTKIASTAYADLSSNVAAGLVNTFVQTNYLTTNTAGSTYLTQASATSNYLGITDASSTYLAKSLADSKGDLIVASANDTFGRLTVGTNGYFLKANSSAANGIEWGVIPTINTLDDIGDATITSATSGDILKWNGTAWVNDSALLAAKAPLASPTFTGTVSGISSTMVGLGNVDNTADTAKPVSTAQQTALGLKSDLASPTFTGVPAAPTAAASTNTTQVATTAFVRAEVAALVGSAGATLDTLGELATALGNDAALSTTLTNSIALKAPLASPTFTGTVTLPSGTVTSAMILDGTIANADISTTAAIDQGKIADTTINAQTASYTLVLADKNKLVEMGVGSGNTLTVPPNNVVAFPVGSTITILQTGAGQCTLTAGSGVTVNGTPGLKLRTTWSSATLIKRATDTWVALGDMVA